MSFYKSGVNTITLTQTMDLLVDKVDKTDESVTLSLVAYRNAKKIYETKVDYSIDTMMRVKGYNSEKNRLEGEVELQVDDVVVGDTVIVNVQKSLSLASNQVFPESVVIVGYRRNLNFDQ